MSETIIIESNRQIAYKQEKKTLAFVDEKNANVDLPNNKWQTRLENGVQINVGDQIQVEAVMVNTRGSPEETIEFTGASGVQDATDVIDNKVTLRVNKYITNRQQFNCNLPLFSTSTQDQNSQAGNYGYISFNGFNNFKDAFPYRGIEGMYEDTSTTFAEVVGGGVFTRPPAPLDDADPTRMYLGTDDFIGYGNVINSPDRGEWNFNTTDIDLEVATGFNTPANIGETLTAQLHQREGDPIKWDENEVQARIIELRGTDGSGTFVSVPSAGITDKSYQTVPTSTGDVFRARQEGNWSASIAGEVPAADEGQNYSEEEGRDLFHRNLLCGNPNEYRNTYGWVAPRVGARSADTLTEANFETTGFYTGSISIDAADVGNWGLNAVMLDQLDYQGVTTNFTFSNNSLPTGATSRFKGTATISSIDFLKVPDLNTLIVTNIVYNENNVSNLSIAWHDNEIPINHNDVSKNATPLTPDLSKQFFQQLYYGRADDGISCGAVGTKINLPNTNRYLYNGNPSLASYQTIQGLDFKCLIREFGQASWNSRNHMNFWSRYDTYFDQTKPNSVNFSFPSQSNFQLTNSKGEYYPQAISKTLNIAIIPVFYKEASLPSPAMRDVPFCAFVTQDIITVDDRIPAPMEGEFFGRSPSCYDNLLAKVVTTQKTSFVFDTSQTPAVRAYPEGDVEKNTRTYQYMPYCMIGADNPTVKFDDNYGRFTISGLHTSVRAGNGIFQKILSQPNTQASTESMCALTTESAICGTNGETGEKLEYTGIVQSVVNNPIISAQSGISIKNIFLYSKKGDRFSSPIDPRKPINYSNTLFAKLGFEIEQLIPYVGKSQSNFNRGSYNAYLGTSQTFVDKYNTMVYPLTTNAYISGADQLSMATNARQYQMENLGGNAPNDSIFINAESDSLVALNLPSKLDYSYLIVYSNIVQNTQFYGGANGQQKIPAMAYVSRNYSTGDFFFGEPTTWTYVADKEYILTEFDTNITLPNGLPAPIENNSSIIYKIIKPKILPPPLEAFEPKKK